MADNIQVKSYQDLKNLWGQYHKKWKEVWSKLPSQKGNLIAEIQQKSRGGNYYVLPGNIKVRYEPHSTGGKYYVYNPITKKDEQAWSGGGNAHVMLSNFISYGLGIPRAAGIISGNDTSEDALRHFAQQLGIKNYNELYKNEIETINRQNAQWLEQKKKKNTTNLSETQQQAQQQYGNILTLPSGQKISPQDPNYDTYAKQLGITIPTKETTSQLGLYVPNPDYLKYYKENEIIRQGDKIYLKPGVEQRWGKEQNKLPAGVPEGAVPIPGAIYNTREKQQAAFSNIVPVGNTLYGIPKEHLDQIEKELNASQLQDMSSDEPPIRGKVEDKGDIFSTIEKIINSKPEPPNFTELYQQYISGQKGEQYKTTDLENELNYWQEQRRNIEQRLKDRIAYEESQPVALGVIQGRTSEIQKQEMRNLEAIDNHIKALTEQLNTKYGMIDTIMKLANTDYKNASDYYDTQYQQALNLYKIIDNQRQAQQKEEEAAKDNARANLQVLFNSISKGLLDVNNLDNTAKATITKLELEAGLPTGITEQIGRQIQSSGSSILYHTSRTDPTGNKYMDMVVQNPDGSLTTKHIFLGKERIPRTSSGEPTYSQKKKEEKEKLIEQDKANIRQNIANITGEDGYVDPNKMKILRKEIADKAPDLLNWFDNAFPPSVMLNPNYEENLPLIEKNKWY